MSEGSIGSNLRRIEAVTGMASVELLQRDERELAEAATLLSTTPAAPSSRVCAASSTRTRRSRTSSRRCGPAPPAGRAAELAAGGTDGLVVARVDDLPPGDLRDLAIAVRNQPGVRAVVLGGRSDTGGAVARRRVVSARSAARRPTSCGRRRKAVKGGGGGKGDVAVAGGKDPGGVDEALDHRPARPRGLLDGGGDAAPAG